MSMGQTGNINWKAGPVYYRREQGTWKLERRCVTEWGGGLYTAPADYAEWERGCLVMKFYSV